MDNDSWAQLLRGELGHYTLILTLGIALHAIDVFVVATIMPTVVADIGGVAYYAWVAMLYMVGSILGTAASGAIRSRTDLRGTLTLAASLYLVGLAGCAMAPHMAWLLVMRTVQGFGAGMIVALSMALIGELYPPFLRKRALASLSTIWAVAAMLGPSIGGFFAEIAWWRGAFWVSVPGILLYGFLGRRYLPVSPARGERRGMPLLRLLLLGGGVLAVAATGQIAWLPGRLASLLLALLLVAGSLAVDRRAGERRMFPSGTLALGSLVGVAYWVFVLISATHVAATLFMPLMLQQVYGVRPLWAGYFNGILALGWTFASITSSGWHGRAENLALLLGPLAMFVALGALVLTLGRLPLPWVALALLVTGAGIGVLNIHLVAATMGNAPAGQESLTASSIPAMRSLGLAFGAALAGLIAVLAGLEQTVTPAIVTRAMRWVLGTATLAPLLMCLLGVRLLWLRRRATSTAVVQASSQA